MKTASILYGALAVIVVVGIVAYVTRSIDSNGLSVATTTVDGSSAASLGGTVSGASSGTQPGAAAAGSQAGSASTRSGTSTSSVGNSTTTRQYGEIALRVGETAVFPAVSIRPVGVLEDSRCAQYTRCVWAGVVRVSTIVGSATGTSTVALTLDAPSTVGNMTIELVGVGPEKQTGQTIDTDDYRFVFDVNQKVQ